MATRVEIGYAPAGIKFAPDEPNHYPAAERYRGTSFCAAVHHATKESGRALLLEPDSIEVCRWAPIVLGFRETTPQFDLDVGFHLPSPVPSILVAPLDRFITGHPPDVVLVRALPNEIARILEQIGPEKVVRELAGHLDRSAVDRFIAGSTHAGKLRVQWVNKTLAMMNQRPAFRKFTKAVFKHDRTTYFFDLLLKRFLANMSLCRNSAVIPFLTGKANVSYFCTGGIAWGNNRPEHMVCGLPVDLAGDFEWVW